MKKSKLANQLYTKIVIHLRKSGITMPIKNATIAVSGGIDSTALAHLLLNWGGNIVDKDSCTLLHINHNWRGEDSLKSQLFVEELAKSLGVKIDVYNIYPPENNKISKESFCRQQRLEIFNNYNTILTGHNSNDLVETILYKTLQGKCPEDGIKIKHNNQLRLLLPIKKDLLKDYLIESNVSWVEDYTNHDGKLLRSNMRVNMMNNVYDVFPDSLKHIVNKSLENQYKSYKLKVE